jgi:hypothetical protein
MAVDSEETSNHPSHEGAEHPYRMAPQATMRQQATNSPSGDIVDYRSHYTFPNTYDPLPSFHKFHFVYTGKQKDITREIQMKTLKVQ